MQRKEKAYMLLDTNLTVGNFCMLIKYALYILVFYTFIKYTQNQRLSLNMTLNLYLAFRVQGTEDREVDRFRERKKNLKK